MNKFIIGLVLGIAIAAGLAFYLNNMPSQFTKKFTNNAQGSVVNSSGPIILAPGTKLQELKNASAASINQNANASGGANASSPSYDFYNILQGEKVSGSEPKVANNASGAKAASGPVSKNKIYVVTGAFLSQDLADDMKAQLTLLGFNPIIRSKNINNKTISRVLIGPFDTEDQARDTIKELSQQNINGLVYKVK